jgi:hypothetical protein
MLRQQWVDEFCSRGGSSLRTGVKTGRLTRDRPKLNARDFRCFVLPGVLAAWCSSCVLKPVSGLFAGMADARVSRRGWRAVPRSAAPHGRAVPPSLGAVCRSGLGEAGGEYCDLGFPGDGGLRGAGVREFRPCFLRPFGVPLPSGDVQRMQAGAGGGVRRGGKRVQ